MALTRPPVTAADGTFSATGSAAWAAGFGVAGATSGGIPYFSSATGEASSALLAAASPVLGGGAGTAPYTDSGFTSSGTGATFVLTPQLLQLGGAGSKSAPAIRLPTDTSTGWYQRTGNEWAFASSGSAYFLLGPNYFSMSFGLAMQWTSGAPDSSSADFGISRINAGLGGIGTGSPGSFAGSLKLATLNVNTSVLPVTNGVPTLGAGSNGFAALYLDYTDTATVGNVTINKPSGQCNMAAGAGTLTVTNSLVTAHSHIFLNPDSAPGNLVAVMFYAVASAGSFTVNAVPAVTNQTAIDFVIFGAD